MKNFFSKPNTTDEVLKIARYIGPQIDQITNEIFVDYKQELLTEPLTYIVPAVWGAIKDGSLSPTQIEINKRIAPVIEEVMNLIVPAKSDDSQKYAIGYILRGLIITKVIFMIEGYKNRVNSFN